MTLDEIAREIGVSKSTVSRALSGKGRMGEDTRKRILEYAGRGNIAVEKKLINRVVTKNIGVVLPADIYLNNGPFFQECILGVCEAAGFLDYEVIISTSVSNDLQGIKSLVEKGKVDGIILTRSIEDDKVLQYLVDTGFPVGLTGSYGSSQVIQVDADNIGASESLTSYLINRGYRKFALVIDRMEYRVNQNRYKGFCNAITNNGLDLNGQIIVSSAISMELIDSMMDNLINQKVECIICGDDVICTRIMSNLQAEGYRIPRDIGVASLYNSTNLECCIPSVTTVNVSARQMGNMICRQMINYLEGKNYQPKTYVDYEILVRKSTLGKGENRMIYE